MNFNDEFWTERHTCWVSKHEQRSPEWKKLRIGGMTASNISKYVGRSIFAKTNEEMANIIMGKSLEIFSEDSLENMKIGNLGEPYLRKWYETALCKPVNEIGLAVWKQDTRFRGSVDGEVDDDLCVEFKIPKNMYKPLFNYIEATSKGYNTEKDYSHIYKSHYDQMMMNCAILDKKFSDYVVYSPCNNLVFVQRVPFNYEHWMNELYLPAVKFYDTYCK
jgi:hypothetical protein